VATVVLAAATSHGPMLSTTPTQWSLRASADRKNPQHWFRGEALDFSSLLKRRVSDLEYFTQQVSPDRQAEQSARCHRHLDTLAHLVAQAQLDVAIVIGNDQRELFGDSLRPAWLVLGADGLTNVAMTNEQRAALPPGIAEAEEGHCPPGGATYRGHPALASALSTHLARAGFEATYSSEMPFGVGKHEGLPHAFGFIYRRLFRDAPPPSIPLFINVGVPPNQPTVNRCLDLGHALAHAVSLLPNDLRVGIIGSGGLSHFVIDEALDRRLLFAITDDALDPLRDISETELQGNTSEIKSWLPVMSAASSLKLSSTFLEYVPCYRTEAGTGNAMGFAAWQ
jgi:hypothetical protein